MNTSTRATIFAFVTLLAAGASLPAVAADNNANVIGRPFNSASTPAQIDSCGATRFAYQLDYAVTFHDATPQTITAVEITNVLVDPFSTVLDNITETLTGTYSPNVSIVDTGLNTFGQRMQIYHTDDYPTARTDICYVSAVAFADGGVWRPAPADMPNLP